VSREKEERGALCTWLAASLLAGDVIPSSGGCRKVRWARTGTGERGGVRVIDDKVKSLPNVWPFAGCGPHPARSLTVWCVLESSAKRPCWISLRCATTPPCTPTSVGTWGGGLQSAAKCAQAP